MPPVSGRADYFAHPVKVAPVAGKRVRAFDLRLTLEVDKDRWLHIVLPGKFRHAATKHFSS